MSTLPTDLRSKLERTCIAARNFAVPASKAALEALAVAHHEPYGHMTKEQKDLRNKLRARARQLGDIQDTKGQLAINHLSQECAYEHWHRMLFARFLAENYLLIEPDMRMAVSLDEMKELAKEEKSNLWALAGRYAQTMLPEVFRADDPVLQVPLAKEDQLKLEQLLDALAKDTFTASDSLGWCYQFWQAQQKEIVNKSGNKISADELPSVTQLFTEDYMVDFLLDNTLGAWHAGRCAGVQSSRFNVSSCPTEDAARKMCALPGVEWKYLRFVKETAIGDEMWTPAAGTFDGWPKTAKELKCLDPCMGSGHFVVAMFERLVALRMAEEKLDEPAAVVAVIGDNLFGLEIDPRCTQIGAFNLALAAWRRAGHCKLPAMNLACSGLTPNAKREEWLKLTEDAPNLRFQMGALYDLFEKAPILGSLINPRADKAVNYGQALHELQPLLEMALAQETKDDTAHEMAVTARGLAKAAEILAGQFTLVATNVPYLGRGKQDEVLQDFCDRNYLRSMENLGTAFVERCRDLNTTSGTTALVTPENWLYLGVYRQFRESLLEATRWVCIAKLGSKSFQTPMWDFNVILFAMVKSAPDKSHKFFNVNAADASTPDDKASALGQADFAFVEQLAQLQNPDARVVDMLIDSSSLLDRHAEGFKGLSSGDGTRFIQLFWERPSLNGPWVAYQGGSNITQFHGGRQQVLFWEEGKGAMVKSPSCYVKGAKAWERHGVSVNQISLTATLYTGEMFDENAAVVVPGDRKNVPALWAFLESPTYRELVRNIDKAFKVTNRTLVKVPFDLAHWQKVAAEKYPHGLPKPFSSDPTQWLFNGHPAGADQPLQVAVARLLGYQWPRQTGISFPDCPALGPDGLEKLADGDGIVCLQSVRGEEPAADRLRKLLAVAFGRDWKPQTELELIRASGSDAADLEEWLRDDFFEQHCELFKQRPFVWHVWDGRKRDGFHALVNYHTLADEKGKGGRTLVKLTHSYLNDWITRQKDELIRGEGGADERLAAALELKNLLEAIIEGEPPFDHFVRWKPLAKQSIGWTPDINDGVRMNIRPFLASDLPNGKKGAGILRSKPNIKWEKDRGKEPQRPKDDFPWFWKDGKFTGDRVNDMHLTKEQKEKTSKKGT